MDTGVSIALVKHERLFFLLFLVMLCLAVVLVAALCSLCVLADGKSD